MLREANSILQAFLATLLTWGLTALGAAFVFVCKGRQRKLLDTSLGFAAGVMTAASFWSLLAPALEMAADSPLYGHYSFLPVGAGFLLGALFVVGADMIMPKLQGKMEEVNGSSHGPAHYLAFLGFSRQFHDPRNDFEEPSSSLHSVTVDMNAMNSDGAATNNHNTNDNNNDNNNGRGAGVGHTGEVMPPENPVIIANWRRIMLLIIAITVHNIPEGLAVGVGFAAIGKTPRATFESARSLAVAIGIQNFPEGLAVSLPLKACGFSNLKSFWYGQLSGMVEPIAGVLGAGAIVAAEPLLPYALAFAAGAMMFVVVDDIIPEAQTAGNGRWASAGSIIGFIIMMCLDVGLG